MTKAVDPQESHARLAPSASDRWSICPASVRMSEEYGEDETSVYAHEGTAAHALAELYVRRHALGMEGGAYQRALEDWRNEFSDVVGDTETEMLVHVVEYYRYLIEIREEYGATLLLEQRMPTGVPGCWGTSDAVLVTPEIVHIVDLKYGLGNRVMAENNSQLRLYGVGALDTFGDLLGDVQTVRMTVFQPRLEHVDTEELEASELRAWRDNLIPVARQALQDDAPFVPGTDACRWCPAAAHCSAQMKWAFELDFSSGPDVLDDEELSEALEAAPVIRKWLDNLESYALDRVYSKGDPIPGWKVVLSGGRRGVVDADGLVKALTSAGYPRNEIVVTKPKGIGDLEKLLGKDFSLAEPYIEKSAGKPSLVRDTDTRPDINPDSEAASYFDALD